MEDTYLVQSKILPRIVPALLVVLPAEKLSDPVRLPAGRRGSGGGDRGAAGHPCIEFP